jgi:hypothetical protein
MNNYDANWLNIIGLLKRLKKALIFLSGFQLRSCTLASNRQDACSTKDKFSCGTGILPVHKRIIENAAKYEFQPT